jgi:hypothetical protein
MSNGIDFKKGFLMNNILLNELSKNGVHCISIIFNSSSRYTGSEWCVVKDDEGNKLYQELVKSMNYRVDEVHSTVWQNGHGLRRDTCYSVNIDFPLLKRKNEVKMIINQLLQLTRKYGCAQIVINNQYTLDPQERHSFHEYRH